MNEKKKPHVGWVPGMNGEDRCATCVMWSRDAPEFQNKKGSRGYCAHVCRTTHLMDCCPDHVRAKERDDD